MECAVVRSQAGHGVTAPSCTGAHRQGWDVLVNSVHVAGPERGGPSDSCRAVGSRSARTRAGQALVGAVSMKEDHGGCSLAVCLGAAPRVLRALHVCMPLDARCCVPVRGCTLGVHIGGASTVCVCARRAEENTASTALCSKKPVFHWVCTAACACTPGLSPRFCVRVLCECTVCSRCLCSVCMH